MQTTTLSTLLNRAPWNQPDKPGALFLGSYPPRECGIATFTEDVRDAYDGLGSTSSDVIAVTDAGADYAYPSCVIGEIQRDHRASYIEAARLANAHPSDVVNIQHEYGLYGGERGQMLIDFLSRLRKPVVLTLHTTLPNPDEAMLHVTRELANRADRIIVLAYTARSILESEYGIDGRKIRVVLHGAPDVPLRDSRHFKKALGLQDRMVLATFGLISRGKGIEYVIDALPAVFERHPDAMYLLLGETHPVVRKQEGESYRESLRQRVVELGIEDRVRFVDHYLTDDEIVAHLLATDVYVSPSLDPHQIVSGTLSYAVACGRLVIATEYLYAKELLADGRGMTVPFRDSGALAGAINLALDDPGLRAEMERNAYRYGRQMTWRRVARRYRHAFVEVTERAGDALVDHGARELWSSALKRHATSVANPIQDTP